MQQCNALKAPHYPGGGGDQEMFVCRRKIHLEDKLLEERMSLAMWRQQQQQQQRLEVLSSLVVVVDGFMCESILHVIVRMSLPAAHAMASHRMRGRQANGRTNDDLNNTTNVDVHNQQYYIGGINQRSSIPIVVIHRCIYLGYAL